MFFCLLSESYFTDRTIELALVKKKFDSMEITYIFVCCTKITISNVISQKTALISNPYLSITKSII